MFKFLTKSAATAVLASPSRILYFDKSQPFSSSLKSVQDSANQQSFSVDYLINSCGFSPELALSASKYVKFESPHKPDSVLAFFENHDFTITQISKIIRKFPPVILCDPQKTLLPKIEFLKSRGVSNIDVSSIVSTTPFLLKRSLKNTIIPSFDFLCNFLESKEKTVAVIKRYGGLLSFDLQTLKHNFEILRESGVPDENIRALLLRQPRVFLARGDRFREIVKEVDEIGFDRSRMEYVTAFQTIRSMTKSTWDKKVEVYKKWGWTEDDVLVAFKKNPWCMVASEVKITRVMDFLVNKMGCESLMVARWPQIISLSLEKRIVPRCEVYQALLSKGLVKSNGISLVTVLGSTEKGFIDRFLNKYKEEAPELLKLYREKFDF